MKQIFHFYFLFGVELPVHLEVIVIYIFQFYFLLGVELPVCLEVTVIYNYIWYVMSSSVLFMPSIPVCSILYQTKMTEWYYIPCNDPTTLDIWPCSFFYLHFELSIPALSKTAASILECVLRRDPHEAEYIQSIQEVVHSLEPVLVKNIVYSSNLVPSVP